jgi:hypothetical protein
MTPAFTSPKFTFTVSYEETKYAFVDNSIQIRPLRGKECYALVEIPTETFMLFHTLFSKAQQELAYKHGAGYYLDEVKDGLWVLGIAPLHEGAEYLDLWTYPRAKLPLWASNELDRR